MTSLYVDRKGLEARLDGGAVAFYEQGVRSGTVPLTSLSRVFFQGDVLLHGNLLAKLGAGGVGVIFLHGFRSEPTLFLPRMHNDASRRVAQHVLSRRPVFRMRFARELLEIKLQREEALMRELADKHGAPRQDLLAAAAQIGVDREALVSAERLDELRGLEGHAAQVYFSGLAATLPASLAFTGRNRRPPRDPFNVVLSLGYALLYAETVLALHEVGLDPYVGFLHDLDFGRASLACDVMEIFRTEVDRFAFNAFRDRVLRPEDFSTGSGRCRMGKAARKRFYPAWEAKAEEIRRELRRSCTALCDGILESEAALSDGTKEAA